MENVFLVDWLTFVVRGSSLDNVKSLLGLWDSSMGGSCHWEELGGCNGYPQSIWFNGIRLLYGASDEMGICVQMSGSGCRAYETFGAQDWNKLFSFLVDPAFSELVHITRLDLAFDDHSGLLDIDRLRADTDAGYYTAKFRWWKCEYGSEGTTLYYGSPQSKIRLRIYDKAAERDLDGEHWIRVELQLRDGNADSAVKYLVAGIPMDTVFSGVLRNYILFREPDYFDSNKSRWPIADYWLAFLDGACPLTLWVKPGCEYNLSNLQRFVVDQAGNAISCFVRIYGWENLAYFLETYKKVSDLPPKYKFLIDLAERSGGFEFDEDETDS